MSMPLPLIWLPLRDVVRVEGANVIVNGGFETAGGPPPTGWSQASLLSSRIAGQRTGGSGSWICQCDWDTINAAGYIGQVAACIVGAPYHIQGWYKSTGAVTGQLYAGLSPVTIPSSAVWTMADGIVTCTTNGAALIYSIGLGAGKAMQWDDISYTPLVAFTKNLGSAGDVLVGDGRTPATMPTMLTPSVNVRRGMASGAATYLRTSGALANDTYSIMFVCNRTFDTAANKYLCDARNGGGTGYFYMTSGGSTLTSSSGTIYVGGQPSTTLPGGIITTAACTGLQMSGPNFLAILNSQALGSGWLGNCYQMAMFQGTLTPQQVSMLSERMLSEVST